MTFSQGKPKFELLVTVNAARMLSEVARSGYEGCVDVAVEIITNPKENDAVRLYAFRALKNVFSAYNADDPSKSVVTTPAKERAAIEALIAYISQKPSLRADVPADEVDAYRYVRREAVRALGAVRKLEGRIEPHQVDEPLVVVDAAHDAAQAADGGEGRIVRMHRELDPALLGDRHHAGADAGVVAAAHLDGRLLDINSVDLIVECVSH